MTKTKKKDKLRQWKDARPSTTVKLHDFTFDCYYPLKTNKDWEEELEKINLCGCNRVCFGHDSLKKELKHFISTLLKQQKQELKEKVKKVSGAVIKGTGRKWLVQDYVRRDDILKLL